MKAQRSATIWVWTRDYFFLFNTLSKIIKHYSTVTQKKLCLLQHMTASLYFIVVLEKASKWWMRGRTWHWQQKKKLFCHLPLSLQIRELPTFPLPLSPLLNDIMTLRKGDERENLRLFRLSTRTHHSSTLSKNKKRVDNKFHSIFPLIFFLLAAPSVVPAFPH